MTIQDARNEPVAPSLSVMQSRLIDIIGRWIDEEGDRSTSIENLAFFRRDTTTAYSNQAGQ